MIDLARDALELAPSEREFNGVTVQIPREHLEGVKERIRKFRKELNEHLSQFETTGDVYQLNLQLFPLTKEDKDSYETK